MTLQVVYEQHPIFYDYINKALDNAFTPDNARIISCVRWNEDGSFKVLAVVAYHYSLKHSVEMSIAAEQGEWATRRFLQAAFDYPFFQEGKEKVIAVVRTNNTRSFQMLERLGYSKEGCLTDYQGADKDCFIYGLTKRQYLASRLAPKERKEIMRKTKTNMGASL